MKSFFKNSIVLISEIILLLISILWYLQDYSYEPLMGIISFGVAVIVSCFFKFSEKENNSSAKKNTVKNVTQTHSGSGDNIGGDKIINN